MVEICAKAAVGNPETLGDCPFCHRVVATLEEKELDYQLNLINLDDQPEWFIDEIPSRELPAMKNEHGHWILQAEEICRIIEELHPEPSLDTPPHLVGVGCNIFGNFEAFLESDDPDDGTEQALLDELEAFDEHIRENGPYIAGEDVTALDFSLTPGLLYVPVALPHFKNWEIPEHLTHVRGYLELMCQGHRLRRPLPKINILLQDGSRNSTARI